MPDTLRIENVELPDGGAELRLGGRLTLAAGAAAWDQLRNRCASTASEVRRIDLSALELVDGAGAAELLSLRARRSMAGRPLELVGASEEAGQLLELYGCPNEQACLKDAPPSPTALEEVGKATVGLLENARDVLDEVGALVSATARAVRRPRSVNWREIPQLMERAGADGVPIIALINFLVGLIIALQAADQLKRYGANVFLADLVGLTMTRELAALMTAIIVAGRSGAAYAAELGTMRVNEEIDALRSLGLDAQRFLVMPRVIALAAVAPLLTLLGMVLGCLGGLVVAMTSLELTPAIYWGELQRAINLLDITEGLTKSVLFAITIVFISCQRGLGTRGGAAGVGRSTTSAVVAILFSLIVLDAIASTLFNSVRNG